MRLYVMRHGPAEDNAASGRDEDRALTASGRDRVRAVAKLLFGEKEVPARVLASPLVRAQETADIVIAAARVQPAGWEGKKETSTAMRPAGEQLALVHRLAKEGLRPTMVVGHEPDLSSLVAQLLDGELPMPMDKAMVVALEVAPDGAAKLRFVIDPRTPALALDRRRA